MILRRVLFAALLVGLSATYAAPAKAYFYCGYHDRLMRMSVYYNNSQFWVDMLTEEALRWNGVHTLFALRPVRSRTVPIGEDGLNVISWISDADMRSAYKLSWDDAVGRTLAFSDVECGKITEADVFFNPAITEFRPQVETPYSLGFQEIALHELGHVLAQDHEDRTLAVMTESDSVSNRLYASDKVGWRACGGETFRVGDQRDIGVFPLAVGDGEKVWSSLSAPAVRRGGEVTLHDFTVQNLSSGIPERDVRIRILLESAETGRPVEIGSMRWRDFGAYSEWDGDVTFRVPFGTPPDNYLVVAFNPTGDSDPSNDRAVLGRLLVR